MMFRKNPLDHIPYLLSELNNVALSASSHAIANQKVVKLEIDLREQGSIKMVLAEQQKTDGTNPTSFAKISNFFLPLNLTLSSKLQLQKNSPPTTSKDSSDDSDISKTESTTSSNRSTQESNAPLITYFMPSGFCEPLYLRIIRNDNNNQASVNISLNPILCLFEVVE